MSEGAPAIKRMCRLTAADFAHAQAFWKKHPGAARRKFGLLFRSPTLWEDIVKTVTICNVRWKQSCAMNEHFCLRISSNPPSFPSPEDCLRFSVETFAALARVGYRAERLLKLAKAVAEGCLDLTSIDQSPPALTSLSPLLLSTTTPCAFPAVVKDFFPLPSAATDGIYFSLTAAAPANALLPASSAAATSVEATGVLTTHKRRRENAVCGSAKAPREGDISPHIGSSHSSKVSASKNSSADSSSKASSSVWAQQREQVRQALLRIEGIGPFASQNILQLLGFYDVDAFDSETIRHMQVVHGVKSKNVRDVHEAARKRFALYAPYQFIAYWFELWETYEEKSGGISLFWTPHNSIFMLGVDATATAKPSSMKQSESADTGGKKVLNSSTSPANSNVVPALPAAMNTSLCAESSTYKSGKSGVVISAGVSGSVPNAAVGAVPRNGQRAAKRSETFSSSDSRKSKKNSCRKYNMKNAYKTKPITVKSETGGSNSIRNKNSSRSSKSSRSSTFRGTKRLRKNDRNSNSSSSEKCMSGKSMNKPGECRVSSRKRGTANVTK